VDAEGVRQAYLISKSQGPVAQKECAGVRRGRAPWTDGALEGMSQNSFKGGEGSGKIAPLDIGRKVVERGPEEIAGIERDRSFAIVAGGRCFFGIFVVITTATGLTDVCRSELVTLAGVNEIGGFTKAKPKRNLLHRDDREEEES
jgi:hypothetical protein